MELRAGSFAQGGIACMFCFDSLRSGSLSAASHLLRINRQQSGNVTASRPACMRGTSGGSWELPRQASKAKAYPQLMFGGNSSPFWLFPWFSTAGLARCIIQCVGVSLGNISFKPCPDKQDLCSVPCPDEGPFLAASPAGGKAGKEWRG